MNTIRNAIVAAGCMMAMATAHAQFVSLGGLAGVAGFGVLVGRDLGANDRDTEGPDVDTFVRRNAALSALAGKSVAAINAAFASESQLEAKRAALAAIGQIADRRDRQARYAAFYEAEVAETRRLLDSGEMRKRMARLNAEQKKMLAQGLYNASVGSLQAADLGKDGQALVQRAGSSGQKLLRLAPVREAMPLLSRVAGDANGILAGVARLAQQAHIDVADAKVGARPTEIQV
jgi:hypothetical protein